jgi:flagellar motor component MotA
MKVTINIDCTPEEARSFMGLPDMAPVHALYVEKMAQLMRDGLSAQDVEKLMRNWMPAMTDSMAEWQRAFWSAAMGKTPS